MAEISRRSFLQVLGLGVSALVAGCERDAAPAVAATAPAAETPAPPEPLPEPPPPSDLPFSVWEELRAALRARGIVTEAMDTRAACRTFNVLLAEDRRVAAALIAR